jgi:hypothetical protein
MTLDELLAELPSASCAGLAFPTRLLGAFRRKSITFANGLTDENTIVYWFQSKTFTIDLRLPDGAATPVTLRQGWVGDTVWDTKAQQLSWAVNRSYQPRNQWPEPAMLGFIGNSVIEYAPSGAYVEDWRQQSTTGPLLGLRLVSMLDLADGQSHIMDGGLIIAGEHAAYAQSRLPAVDDVLIEAGDLAEALASRLASELEVESYEVSVATSGLLITHSTQPHRLNQPILTGDFEITPDGFVAVSKTVGGVPCQLRFKIDCYETDFAFAHTTTCTPDAALWLEQEKDHLMHHAIAVR